MAVSLPTAADVRKVREQAVKSATERAEVAKTPLLAVLGAGDATVAAAQKAVADARTRANARREEVASRVADAQTLVSELPQKLSVDEVRKSVTATVTELREQAGHAYAGFAERGEQAWGKIRQQPQVKQAIATVESYTEQLDARVDAFVDDAHDAAEKVLATVTRQTRSTGEKVARTTQKAAAGAAEAVTEASEKVAEAGTEVAAEITEAGEDAAHATRSTTRRAANRTAPKAAARKPATRRTNGSTAK